MGHAWGKWKIMKLHCISTKLNKQLSCKELILKAQIFWMQKHTALFVSAGWRAQSVDTKAILATICSGQCTIMSYSDIPPAVLYNMARRYVAWTMGIDDIMFQMQ